MHRKRNIIPNILNKTHLNRLMKNLFKPFYAKYKIHIDINKIKINKF